VFEAKRRPRSLVLPVLVPSIDAAGRIAKLGGIGRSLAEVFWPGPVTIVAARADGSLDWALGNDDETIGVRMPAHPSALRVLDRTGPLAVTSANRSGEPTPETCDGVRAVFGETV